MKILITGGSGFIGTNLIDLLIEQGYKELLNIDVKKPFKNEQVNYWNECSVLDYKSLDAQFSDFKPDCCIHLAAETQIKEEGDIEDVYPVNIMGSEIICKLIKKHGIKRSIMISTQFVCGPSKILAEKHDDYWPHTVYGESKVIMEKNVRTILDPGTFIIVRPTYIWGPWHFKNFRDLVKSIRRGFYVHPAGEEVIRSYGYVKNICHQLIKLAEIDHVERDWFYVGDRPMDSYKFVNSLSLALRGKGLLKVPRLLLQVLAFAGDFIKLIPINSFRYKNMVTQYPTPMETTFKQVGDSPYSMEESVIDYHKWFEIQKDKF